MTFWEILGIVVAVIVVLVIGFLLGIVYRKKVAEREISSAEEEAKRIINEIALVGWVSGGHSAGYVPVFAIGAGAELFQGRMDNIEIPVRIAQAGGYK